MFHSFFETRIWNPPSWPLGPMAALHVWELRHLLVLRPREQMFYFCKQSPEFQLVKPQKNHESCFFEVRLCPRWCSTGWVRFVPFCAFLRLWNAHAESCRGGAMQCMTVAHVHNGNSNPRTFIGVPLVCAVCMGIFQCVCVWGFWSWWGNSVYACATDKCVKIRNVKKLLIFGAFSHS